MNIVENKSRRLAKNTFMLTCRMLFLLGINLYTSRVVLNSLGVEDYGIYNAVGGIVTIFSIISSSITSAITRYITYELGKGQSRNLTRVFSTAILIQLLLAILVACLVETLGVWFLNAKMNIPIDRINAANWVFQISLLTFIINIISVPYNAVIIAYEKMKTFAFVGIYEGVLKLLIAYFINVSPLDKLIFYSLALCLLSISVRIIYGIYCKCKFNECIFRLQIDSQLIKEMFSFAGWNFIGASASLLRDQGGSILINIFCGPIANAARGIAYQVSSAVMSFVNSFTTAMHPQITKSYSSGDYSYFISLIFRGSKISYFILFSLSLPIILCTEIIVNFWLGQVPQYTVTFIRLILVLSMSETISNPLITAMLATGDIKRYQIVVGGLNLMNLPLSYIFLKCGMPPHSVFLTAIAISQICLFARVYLLKQMIGLNAFDYIKQVYLKLLLVSIVTPIPILFFIAYYPIKSFTNLFIISIMSFSISLVSIYLIGFTQDERNICKRLISRKHNY